MSRPLTVPIMGFEYAILDSPEPLSDDDGCRCMALPDHQQRIIWVDPKVLPRDRCRVLLLAVSNAWHSLLNGVPLVD